MKKYIASYLFLSFTLIASAQTFVKGKVLEKISREPLELAFVKYANTQSSTLTNKTGYFSLPMTGDSISQNAFISISFIGYNSQLVPVDQSKTELIVEMEKGSINLQEVVISSHTAANSFHTISKIDLNLQPVKSAQAILRTVPGLFIGQHQEVEKRNRYFCVDLISTMELI